MTLIFIYVLIYILVLVGITVVSSRHETDSDYINSAKNLSTNESTWTTFASLLTGYNFVIGVTFAYLYGFWYLMAFVGAGLAFVVFYFIYKSKFESLQRDHDLLSIGDYFGVEYGVLSRNLVNSILLVGLLLFLILQLFVNTGLFASLLNLEKIPALLITVGAVSTYLWFGGFKVSVKTDIFQGILMLPIVITVFVLPFHFSTDNIASAFDPSQFWFAVGLALLQFLSLLGQAESFQRVFAVRNAKALKNGLLWSFGLLVLVAGSIAYLGINFKFSGVVSDPSVLFTEGVLGVLPAWLASLLTISLIAAFMGTIDSSAFAFGVLMSRIRNNKKISVGSIRIFMLFGIVVSAIGSLYLFSFLSSVFALISLVSVVGASLLVSVIFKPITIEINAFLITGTIVFILGLVFKYITDNPLTSLVPTVTALVVLVVMMVFRRM